MNAFATIHSGFPGSSKQSDLLTINLSDEMRVIAKIMHLKTAHIDRIARNFTLSEIN